MQRNMKTTQNKIRETKRAEVKGLQAGGKAAILQRSTEYKLTWMGERKGNTGAEGRRHSAGMTGVTRKTFSAKALHRANRGTINKHV